MLIEEALLLVLLQFMVTTLTEGRSCGTQTITGDNNPQSENDYLDDAAGSSLMVLNYPVTCDCGSIYEWEYYAKSNSGTVHFQVWREIGNTDVYTLVGENIVTVTAAMVNKENTASVAIADRIQVLKNDVLGWYYPGSANIANDRQDRWRTHRQTSAAGGTTVGDTFNWGAIRQGRRRKYGMNAKVKVGTKPRLSNLSNTPTIEDTSPLGYVIYTLAVSDPDGDPLATVITSPATSTYFSFNTTTLQVAVQTNGVPAGTYTLTFRTTDFCGLTDTETLTITVTNTILLITNIPAYAFIHEDTILETLLYNISTIDPSPLDTVTCSLTSGQFRTKPTSASVYGVYSRPNPGLNYGTTKTYNLIITCTDSYGGSDTRMFYVYVLPNTPPTFTNMPNSISIAESTAAGVSVFQVVTNDVDGDVMTFTWTCSVAVCPFTLSLTGELTTNIALTGLTTASYEIYISITDLHSTVGLHTLSIAVTGYNSAPVIQNPALTFPRSVTENVGVGTSVYQVLASDVDSLTQTLTYTATFTPVQGGTIFNIHPDTGLLTTASTIDYEALATTIFTVAVDVSDGLVTDSLSVQVDVIDENEPPSFLKMQHFSSGPEGGPGTVFSDPGFQVTEPDTSDVITYTTDCGDFAMNSTTGSVSLETAYDLDIPGTPTSVTCNVQASDGQFVASAMLFIAIDEVDDNNPRFAEDSYTIFINTNVGVGDVMITMAATDGDIGLYGTLTYTLDQTALADTYFSMTGTGELYVAKSMSSLGDGVILMFTAIVTDYGGLSDTTQVTIIVKETSTASSTTTTERYQTFIEDTRNVAWLTSLALFAFGSICVVGYLIYRHDILTNFASGIKSAFTKSKPHRRPKQTNNTLRLRDLPKRQSQIEPGNDTN